ncbi:MAG: hypothetical protein HY814_05245 [Candidatus Riflebacteria bacterium]|nr:hypothetical protein [Candidatus Riflebacteria bacterium]
MDRWHSVRLGQRRIRWLSVEASRDWVREHTRELPDRLRSCERAIWAVLRLQIDMLHRLVVEIDPAAASSLDDKVHKRRVRPESERFYHDARDRYICEVLELLDCLAAYQTALGVKGKPELTFPTGAKTALEVQEYLLERVQVMAARAQRVPAMK